MLTSPDAARTFHWVQRWERAPAAAQSPFFSSFSLGATARLGTIVPSWTGPRAYPVRVCDAELQPEGALPLLEPADLLAGDPVVAAPLQLWQAPSSGAGLAWLVSRWRDVPPAFLRVGFGETVANLPVPRDVGGKQEQVRTGGRCDDRDDRARSLVVAWNPNHAPASRVHLDEPDNQPDRERREPTLKTIA